LDEAEMAELAAYLQGLGFSPAMPLRRVSNWQHAGTLCHSPSDEWWRAEEAERERLERNVRLDPADRGWLELNSALHGAAAVAAARAGCADAALIRVAAGAASSAAYQARLARAAGAESDHPFLRKYALYSGGRWPLGVYDGAFAIF
jgi:hypothetical protein